MGSTLTPNNTRSVAVGIYVSCHYLGGTVGDMLPA